MSPIWRGVKLTLHASPVAAPCLFLIDVLQGLAPAIVFGASAALIDQAPRALTSPGALRAVVVALAVIAAVLIVQRTTQALVLMLTNLVTLKTEAAVDEVRMAAVGALPGLAHFDRPATADRLTSSTWAAPIGRLPNDLGFLIRWSWGIIAASVVAARVASWAPLILVGVWIPFMVLSWRQVGWIGSLRLKALERQRTAGYYAYLGLGAEPAREVRLFGLARWILGRQRSLWAAAMRPIFAAQRTNLIRIAALAAPRLFVSLIPFGIAVDRLLRHDISGGVFAAGVMSLATIAELLPSLEQVFGGLRESTRYLPELFSLAELPAADPGLSLSGRRLAPHRLDDGIRFEDVRFTYPGSETPVLDGVDLLIPAGSSLALVGENGAGKSTLVKLLCRFYDPDDGRITIDGVDLRELDLRDVRRHLAVSFQDLTALPFTVAENIAVGALQCHGDAGLVATAAGQSGAADVVAGLPHGWDTLLVKDLGGIDLSGGEWQRIALARTIMRRLGQDTPILVLDEPTAALDVTLEQELRTRIAALSSGLTTLLVSHRLSTVRICDRIAVLDQGRITESGSHTDLVRTGGVYARLYEMQARPFRHGATRE